MLATLVIKRQINEFEDTYEKELGSRTRDSANRAGSFAQMDVWRFTFMMPCTRPLLLQSWLLPTISKSILLVSSQMLELHAVLPVLTTSDWSISFVLVLELPPHYLENKIFSLQIHFTSDLCWAWQTSNRQLTNHLNVSFEVFGWVSLNIRRVKMFFQECNMDTQIYW